MNKQLFSLFLTSILLIGLFDVSAQDAVNGKELFNQNCRACHYIGKGKLVGPDLINISQLRPEAWILRFVKSSQSVIKSGDKYADSLFKAYNEMIMPDQPHLDDTKIKDIIAYISAESSAPTATASAATNQQTDQQIGKASESFFTTSNKVLLGAIFFMLIVIAYLARINKSLVEDIKDYYSSNKSFF